MKASFQYDVHARVEETKWCRRGALQILAGSECSGPEFERFAAVKYLFS